MKNNPVLFLDEDHQDPQLVVTSQPLVSPSPSALSLLTEALCSSERGVKHGRARGRFSDHFL